MSFFKKTKGEKDLAAKKEQTENPYMNARRSWNGHVSGVMSAVQTWQVVGIASLLIGLSALGGMIYIGSQPKFVPLVFQQDGTGNTVSMTRADRIPDAKVEDYRTAVTDFISSIRLVTPDSDLQTKAVWRTYGYLAPSDTATIKANEFLNGKPEDNPFKRAANETVSVEIKSALQQSKDTWQVDWLETVRARDGTPKGAPYVMRALVTIYQNSDAELKSGQMFINPHFIFVRDYNWSKQL